MCLSPIKIKIKSKRISQNHSQKLWIEVPCGHCAECMQLKRDQWYLRNYWHSKECFDKGGYVLFDTLTYDDEHLPHISDFFPEVKGTSLDYSCFCYDHYKNFMKRLRTNLTRGVFEPEYIEMKRLREERKHYSRKSKEYADLTYEIECLDGIRKTFPVARSLNAFCVTEYGDEGYYRDDRGRMRKATFRPHYHLLFYVNTKTIDALTLSKYIWLSWQKGRTDCCDLNGNVRVGYVRTHNCIGKNYQRNGEIELRKVSNYVAKYITKDAKYSDKIAKRLVSVTSNLFSNSIDNLQANIDKFRADGLPQRNFGMYCMYDSKDQAKLLRHLSRLVDGFHLQGEGFGLYALDPRNLDESEILERGAMSMPDSKKVRKYIPVPMYYIRKLYYRLERSAYSDSPYWVLKPKGKKYLESSIRRSYSSQVRKYTNLSLNLSQEDRIKLDNLLNGRTIEDYAKYLYFYKDTIIGDNGLDLNLDSLIKKRIDYARHPYGDYEYWQGPNGSIYGPVIPFGDPEYDIDTEFRINSIVDCINNLPVCTCAPGVRLNLSKNWCNLIDFSDVSDWSIYSFDEFCSGQICCAAWYNPFVNFDKIDSLFEPYIKRNSKQKQHNFECLEKNKSTYRKNFQK